MFAVLAKCYNMYVSTRVVSWLRLDTVRKSPAKRFKNNCWMNSEGVLPAAIY